MTHDPRADDVLPTYESLAAVGREQLWGLIEQQAGPAWTATYEYRWERDHQTRRAVRAALHRAATGERTPAPAREAPRFLLPLVTERLARMSTTRHHDGELAEMRLLERLGLVELEHDDAYVLAVISALDEHPTVEDAAAALRRDSGLLAQVWRFFEVEGGGEVSLANVDKFNPRTGWKRVLGELVADGTLDRRRVLACCVEALGRDFSAYRAGWFSAFLESIEPDAAELAILQPQLRRLLGSTVTATTSAAARALTKVAAAGLLDDDACADLVPGLTCRTKGTAAQALGLLRGVAKRRPDLHEVVARSAAAALHHEHPDIQRAAVALLATLGAADLAVASADLLAPTVRRQACEAVDDASAPDPAPSGSGGAGGAGGAGGLPADVIASIRGGLAPAAVPVPSDADLLPLVAALLEDADDPMPLEAALAALAVTSDPGLLTPLARRAAVLLKRPGFAVDHPVRAALARLVLAATGAPDGRGRRRLPADPTGLLRARLHHVEDVLAGRLPRGPLLATPTDSDGWVAPQALLDRLATNPEPAPADLVAALLRLAPEGRPAARDAFADRARTDETGDVVRHALGAPPPAAGAAAVRTSSLWVAASRARHPLDDDPLLLTAGLTAAGQGRPVRGRLDIRTEPLTYSDAQGTHTVELAGFGVVFDDPHAKPAPLEPTRVHRPRAHQPGDGLGPDWARWAATTYPHDTEPVFGHVVVDVVNALVYWESYYMIPPALLALARHPGRVGPLGATTAAAGLAAQDATHRILAVDAVVALAARGTLDPHALAAAMCSIAPVTRLPRWASSLEQVAATIGSRYVVDVLTGLVPHLPRDARGLVKLLDLLAEESTRLAHPVSDPLLRPYLQSFSGGSGATAAARRTLALQ